MDHSSRKVHYLLDNWPRGYGQEEEVVEELAYVSKLQPPPDQSPSANCHSLSATFELGQEKLVNLIRDHDCVLLQQLGGVKGVARLLQTNLQKGLDGDFEDTNVRKKIFGENTYPNRPGKSLWMFFRQACSDATLLMLLVCAALSLAFDIKSEGRKDGWYEGASIALAVILVACVTSISDYSQSLQFEALSKEKNKIPVQVTRGGRRLVLSSFDLVVGDLVNLDIGDQVPADGLLIHGQSLAVDESSMTGESELVSIDRMHPFLVSGCKIADGYGSMIVTGVGMRTEWGQRMSEISHEASELTPLQARLMKLATFIGQIGLSVAMVMFIILVISYFTGHTSSPAGTPKFRSGQTKVADTIDSLVEIFAIAIAIVVVAVPEGLPLAVTQTLAYAMGKLMADKAIVRRVSACEVMGCATSICIDKTGTLTLDQMTVVDDAWVAGEMRKLPMEFRLLGKQVREVLLQGIVQNSSGSIFVPEKGGEAEITGSPTEKALLSWGLRLGLDVEKARSESSVLKVEAFSSEKKRGGVAIRMEEGGRIQVHWNGAAEMILSRCERWADGEGLAGVAMTEGKRIELKKVTEGMAAAGLRCVAFAYREVEAQSLITRDDRWKIPETELTLIAIVGMKNPSRPGARDAVGLCRAAGVSVRMVTGDSLAAAKAIAAECGILQPAGCQLAVDGQTFRSYSCEERKRKLPNIAVLASSSPSDKLLLVQTLKEIGEVVAVTGYRAGDAPALHEADVGLAIGIHATDVAKDSSDVVIMDDDFASVLTVLRWGRAVRANIQKFVQFHLTVNVVALAISFVVAVAAGSVPLTAVQLLWVSLIMDTLGALALATEAPTEDLLFRNRVDPLVTPAMWRNIVGQALYQSLVLLTLQFRGREILRLAGPRAEEVKRTIVFNAFVLCQLFNQINARRPLELNAFKGLLKNRLFLAVFSSTLILQVVMVQFLHEFASTVKLGWVHWLVCFGIASLCWPVAVLVKLIPVDVFHKQAIDDDATMVRIMPNDD